MPGDRLCKRTSTRIALVTLATGLLAGACAPPPTAAPAVTVIAPTPGQEQDPPAESTLPPTATPLPFTVPERTPTARPVGVPTQVSPLSPSEYGVHLTTEYGIQIHGCGPYSLDEALDLVKEGGFTWVKQQVRWKEIEGVRGAISWDCLDAVVAGANARGLKVLLSINTAPDWAKSHAESEHPASAAIFADFCRKLVDRYGRQIHGIEVFNEPNLSIEWGPGINVPEYADMLEATYYAIKQTYPGIMVISAAPAPTEWSAADVAIPDSQFLTELVEAGGVRWVDCVGAHFNHGTSSPLEEDGPFEQLILGYRDTVEDERPICITELGYAVPRSKNLPQGFEWAAGTTAEEQAQWLAEVWDWSDAHPRVMRLVIVWNLDYWSDDPEEDANTLYALWSPHGLMPAFYTLQERNRRPMAPGR